MVLLAALHVDEVLTNALQLLLLALLCFVLELRLEDVQLVQTGHLLLCLVPHLTDLAAQIPDCTPDLPSLGAFSLLLCRLCTFWLVARRLLRRSLGAGFSLHGGMGRSAARESAFQPGQQELTPTNQIETETWKATVSALALVLMRLAKHSGHPKPKTTK